MRSARLAEQQAVALRVVAASGCVFRHFHRSSVTVLAESRRYALRHDCAAGILAYMYHFCAGVGLLIVVGHCDRIEFTHGVVAFQHAAWVFPCDCRACLHLCPRQFREVAAAQSAFRHEVVDAAFALLVARVPVLDSGILHFCAVLHHDFHYCGVQLVLVAHWSRAAFEV